MSRAYDVRPINPCTTHFAHKIAQNCIIINLTKLSAFTNAECGMCGGAGKNVSGWIYLSKLGCPLGILGYESLLILFVRDAFPFILWSLLVDELCAFRQGRPVTEITAVSL